MKINAKTEYACRALLELSMHWPMTTPLQIQTIATHQKIPMKFLTHIMIQLKQLGLVQSIRGKMGGYILSKAPKDICLKDVFAHFSEGTAGVASYAGPTGSIFSNVWQELEEIIGDKLKILNFEVLKEQYSQTKDFNYVI